MLRFAEEILLLLLDDKGGKFADVPTLWLDYALAGAVLMDLALDERIDTDLEKLVITDPTPLGDDLLDPTLARIVRSDATHDTRYWIEDTIKHTGEVRERALERLIDRGILRQEEDRVLWVFQTRRYPVIDNRSVREVKLRIMEVLLSDEIPDARDIVIISLADACGIFGVLLSSRELKSVSERIEQIRRLDLIGREVSMAIREIEASLALAMAPMH